ncbi:MAG: hypothetical protein LBU30_05195 [Candidatus Methanoplasma sp.]|nr:hypothetical protein [Candidatus Methanoplasma sp.]
MPYRIPDEDIISDAVSSVIGRTPHIETQAELLRLVRDELLKRDGEYRVGVERIRRIGLERGILKVSIEYRESDAGTVPHICPVCGNAMSSVMNRSLDGDPVEIGRKCVLCPYAVGRTVLVPSRYVFSGAKSEAVSRQEISVRKLRKASAKIREAIDLINGAVGGTGLGGRGDELVCRLRELADSDESPISVRNISLDVRQAGEGPDWLRPAVSVKNSDRKDI